MPSSDLYTGLSRPACFIATATVSNGKERRSLSVGVAG